jgi:acyl transferase domain-containing protein
MESLAIIGMGCRFSGEATNPEKLWDLLVHKKSTWSEIPESRFRAKGVYHPNQKRKGLVSIICLHY